MDFGLENVPKLTFSVMYFNFFLIFIIFSRI